MKPEQPNDGDDEVKTNGGDDVAATTSATPSSPSSSQAPPSDTHQPPRQPAEEILDTSPLSRTDLVNKARSFLFSPSVISENAESKRKFLQEKGLTPGEIEMLMVEVANAPPPVPPRTYPIAPPPPPSQLPGLLVDVGRFFGYFTSASLVMMLLYYRFILPRLSQTLDSRNDLQRHELKLLETLNSELESLKASIKSDLPRSADDGSEDVNIQPQSLPDLLSHLSSLLPTSSAPSTLHSSLTSTLQSFSSLNTYISSTVFSLSEYGGGYGGIGSKSWTPAEEEVRREIRSLKGLLLNRRFPPATAGSLPRPAVPPTGINGSPLA